jgi:predicted metal-binding protein
MLDEYETAYVIWLGQHVPGRQELVEIEREVFLLGYWKALLFACGPCDLCSPCPLEHPCRHPRHARPSMEACGIDVYETAHRAGFPLEVVRTREDTPNFYSLLLVE